MPGVLAMNGKRGVYRKAPGGSRKGCEMDPMIMKMYVEFRRLKGYPALPASGLDQMIDDSTGLTDQSVP